MQGLLGHRALQRELDRQRTPHKVIKIDPLLHVLIIFDL